MQVLIRIGAYRDISEIDKIWYSQTALYDLPREQWNMVT